MKGIRTESACGPGLKSDIRVLPSWITSCIFMGRRLGLLIGRLVAQLAIASTGFRDWKLFGEKSIIILNLNTGLLLKWLKRYKIIFSLVPARISRTGIRLSVRFVMPQLPCVLMK